MANEKEAVVNPTNNVAVLYGDATLHGTFDKINVVKGTLRFSGTVKVLEVDPSGSVYVQEGSDVGQFKLHPGARYQYGDEDPITGWC